MIRHKFCMCLSCKSQEYRQQVAKNGEESAESDIVEDETDADVSDPSVEGMDQSSHDVSKSKVELDEHSQASSELRCTYRAYNDVDEITAAYCIGFNPAGTKDDVVMKTANGVLGDLADTLGSNAGSLIQQSLSSKNFLNEFVQCWALPSNFKTLSLNYPYSSTHPKPTSSLRSLSFSSTTSHNVFSTGLISMSPVVRPTRHSIICEAAPNKKADSAAKRARQAEKRRVYNKARKSEVKTRMKKVLEALDVLRKKSDAQPEEVLAIEQLIAEAYSIIDKAVKVGTLHRNTGARRKSRLARRKKAVEIHHGWFCGSQLRI
ncbi:hypothetical protein LOK49_LG06G00762 [Camellia lanceoleosa]|uniref:Uncharacterized protein n=1 Tax=Camellia lanceoleosa TaxID=1840588 RepID=A0ACC0HCX2_9ERIC|nr:hypothetical protein LOK49_LG06G00762 [Camellia lanceoleosa]